MDHASCDSRDRVGAMRYGSSSYLIVLVRRRAWPAGKKTGKVVLFMD